MKARRMRGLAGCVVGVIVVVSSAAAVAAGGSPPLQRIEAKTWSEAQAVHTLEQLRAVSPQARALVITPTTLIAEVGVYGPGFTKRYAASHGKVQRACYDIWLSTRRLNVFGSVLMQERTRILNWCNNGTNITSQPTVQRSISARWGWAACGWDDDYTGWLRGTTHFGAGGRQMFAYGSSCTGATPQGHHDVRVRGDGTYYVSY